MKAPDLRDPGEPEDGPDRIELGGEPACLLPLLETHAGQPGVDRDEPAAAQERPAEANPTEEDSP